MHCYVIGLGTLNFVLRIICVRVMGISFVIDVLRVNLDDRAVDLSGLRIPGYEITNFEPLYHQRTSVTVSALPIVGRRATFHCRLGLKAVDVAADGDGHLDHGIASDDFIPFQVLRQDSVFDGAEKGGEAAGKTLAPAR
jgi:hypothetical protein